MIYVDSNYWIYLLDPLRWAWRQQPRLRDGERTLAARTRDLERRIDRKLSRIGLDPRVPGTNWRGMSRSTKSPRHSPPLTTMRLLDIDWSGTSTFGSETCGATSPVRPPPVAQRVNEMPGGGAINPMHDEIALSSARWSLLKVAKKLFSGDTAVFQDDVQQPDANLLCRYGDVNASVR